jgi:hypothetical protein
MVWNYRIVVWADDELEDEEFFLEIREVFYDVNGVPFAHGRATIMSEDIDGLHDVIDMMQIAFTKEILRYPDDFSGDMEQEESIH